MTTHSKRTSSVSAQTVRRKSRRLRVAFVVTLTVFLFIALLPTIIASTPLRNSVLRSVFPLGDLNLTAKSASFGWFSPVRLYDLQITDPQGVELLSIEQIELEKSTLDLLTEKTTLGHVKIHQLAVHLQTTSTGSNLEAALKALERDYKALLKSLAINDPKKQRDLSLEILTGFIHLKDHHSNRQWLLNNISLKFSVAGLPEERTIRPIDLELAAELGEIHTETSLPNGQITLKLTSDKKHRYQLSLEADRLPASAISPFLKRYDPTLMLGGIASLSTHMTWTSSAAASAGENTLPTSSLSNFTSTGNFSIAQTTLQSTTYLSDPQLQLGKILIPWRISSPAGHLQFDQLKLYSELGSIGIKGSLPIVNRRSASSSPTEIHLAGHLDLAKLIMRLPKTLSLHPEVMLKSGNLDFNAQLKSSPTGLVCLGSFTTQHLTGNRSGHAFTWKDPLRCNFNAIQKKGQFVLQNLDCFSDFLRLQITPRPNQALHLGGTFNLTKLASRLGMFLDLSRWQLSGQGSFAGELTISPTRYQVENLRFEVAHLNLVNKHWHINEPKISATTSFLWDIPNRHLSFKPNASSLVSNLLNLDLQRLEYQLPTQTSPARFSTTLAFKASAHDLYNLYKLSSPNQSPAPPGSSESYIPFGDLHGNLTITPPQNNAPSNLHLQLNGTNLAVKTMLPAAPHTPPLYQSLWSEPSAQLTVDLTHHPTQNQAILSNLTLVTPNQRFTGHGKISQLTSVANLNIAGVLNFNLQNLVDTLSKKIDPTLKSQIDLVAQNSTQVSLSGPLNPASVPDPLRPNAPPTTPALLPLWQASATLPWQSAKVFNLPIGPGKLVLQLAQGNLLIEPLHFSVGQGEFRATPSLALQQTPLTLQLASGLLCKNIEITPDVSEQILKYIAPVFSGATRTQGLFSLGINDSLIVPGHPFRHRSQGTLYIDSVQVKAGPAINQWLQTARQLRAVIRGLNPNSVPNRANPNTILTIQKNQVPFKVLDGRVFHSGLKFQIEDLVIYSSGSVGLDNTLAIVLEIPIQDKWLAGQAANPLFASLRGQKITIPIHGTLQRPLIDRRAIEQISKQMLRGAAGNLLENELNKVFEGFLRKNSGAR